LSAKQANHPISYIRSVCEFLSPTDKTAAVLSLPCTISTYGVLVIPRPLRVNLPTAMYDLTRTSGSLLHLRER